jgi:hypothetical protein
VDIGLEPGVYDVRYEKEPKALRARLEIKEGPHQQIDVASFGPASLEFTRLRGVDTSSEYLLNGRQMVAVSFGMWSGPAAPAVTPAVGVSGATSLVSAGRLVASAEYLRFVREDLALGAGIHAAVDSADSTFTSDAVSLRSRVGLTVPVVLRWNPIRSFTSWHGAEPYLRGTFGPLLAARTAMRTDGGHTVTETTVNATVAGSAGVGADIRVGRSWMAGMSASYLYSGEIKDPGIEPARFKGWEVRFGVGVIFGAGKSVRR